MNHAEFLTSLGTVAAEPSGSALQTQEVIKLIEAFNTLEERLRLAQIAERHAGTLAMLAVNPKALNAELAQASEQLQRLSGELRNLKELAGYLVEDCIAGDIRWARSPNLVMVRNLLEGRCYHPWHVDASGTNLTCPRCKAETR